MAPPKTTPSPPSDVRVVAALGAGALVAQQVLSKAARDALFLSQFPVSRLPLAMTCGAILSGAVVLASSAIFARTRPARLLPAAFALNAAFLVLEWLLAGSSESTAALLLYGHTSALGATLASSFWSVVSDCFDPHAAKRALQRVSAGAALGGVVGGGLALVVSGTTTLRMALLPAAAMNAVCFACASSLARRSVAPQADPERASRTSGVTALGTTPYLLLLAVVVLLGAIVQSLLDYGMGLEATRAFGKGPRLLAFFATFQTVVGLASFLLSWLLGKPVLRKLGLGGTMLLLPGSVAAVGALVLVWPSLALVSLQRACEGTLRASLFRAAYEALFTPVTPELKRPSKTLIDVGFDRIGTILGGLITLAIVALGTTEGTRWVTLFAVAASIVTMLVCLRVHGGYVQTLTERLRDGALTLADSDALDRTTRLTLSRTMQGLDRKEILARIQAMNDGPPQREDVTHARARLSGLRVPDDVHEIIELLGREDLARDAAMLLAPHASRIAGQLGDVLLDDARSPELRRRCARVLSRASSPLALSVLLLGLAASDVTVRKACARSLVAVCARAEALAPAREPVLLAVGQLLTAPPDADLALGLLSTVFPREPMTLARDALRTDDDYLRGVALEYLETTLPAELWTALVPHLRRTAARTAALTMRTASEPVLEELLRSRAAISSRLLPGQTPEEEQD